MSGGTAVRDRAPAESARFAARARERRRARWRTALITLVLAGIVGAAVWALAFSSLLAVRSVTVAGVHRLSADEVSRAARVPTGGSLALLDSGGIVDRVAALAPVAKVSVHRLLPHTVRIVVTERTPTMVVRTPNGLSLVDAEGVVFASVLTPPDGLPVVRTARLEPAPETLTRAAEMLAALPAKVRADVVGVHADTADDMSVQLTGGRRVVWGGPGQARFKADVLTVLIHEKGGTYDVSVPEAPVVRR
jgi:cell division protein FtsQ